MQHFYRDVPGWAAFRGLYTDMVRKAPHAPQQFVEVGSWLGRSAVYMAVEIANSRKPIKFACIDPWYDGGPDLSETKYYKELNGAKPYDLFLKNIRPVSKYILAMRMLSVEGARFFQDDSVDFLMIDGLHTYEAVKEDIEAWMPKMKPGSVISGDDYNWPGVAQAVDEAASDGLLKGRQVHVITRKNAPKDYKLGSAYWVVQL